MSTPPSPPSAMEIQAEVAEGSKKRKRTGKAREERKKAAIQAQLELELQAQEEQKHPETEQLATVELADEEAGASKAFARSEVDVEQAAKRIPQALKSLHPIFKQAKTFETRRLIKKIKFLRTKPDTEKERTDLEAQLKLISHIQLHTLAQSHLNAKLRKHPLLKHSTLPPSLANALTPTTEPPASTSATTSLVGKVENRLCSAKTVADPVKSVIAWIVGEQGAKLILGGSTGKKVPVEKKAVMNPARAARIAAGDEDDVTSDGEDDEDEEELVPRMVVEGASDLEIGSDDEADQGDYAADAAGWESGSLSGGEGSDSDSDAISLPPASKRGKVTQEREQKVKTKTGKGEITSSTFLPSLAVGFTRGDEGDSDPDLDYDPDGVIGTKKAERKNRRGQRARQAIWEKKYGKGAKHVVKARQEEQAQKEKVSKAREERELAKKLGRDSGWGAKAKIPTTTASAPAPAPAVATPAFTAPALPISVDANTNAEAEKKLHPSWEAARLRKQKMGMATVPAQSAKSNKIVFD